MEQRNTKTTLQTLMLRVCIWTPHISPRGFIGSAKNVSAAYLSILGSQVWYLWAYDVMLLWAPENIKLANVLLSTMQGEGLEKRHRSPETGSDKFEEIVCTSKLIPLLLPWLDIHRYALPSRRGLSSSVSQNWTPSKAKGKAQGTSENVHLRIWKVSGSQKMWPN